MAGLVSQMAHLFALIDHVSDREQEWIPTGGKSSSRQRTEGQHDDQGDAGDDADGAPRVVGEGLCFSRAVIAGYSALLL